MKKNILLLILLNMIIGALLHTSAGLEKTEEVINIVDTEMIDEYLEKVDIKTEDGVLNLNIYDLLINNIGAIMDVEEDNVEDEIIAETEVPLGVIDIENWSAPVPEEPVFDINSVSLKPNTPSGITEEQMHTLLEGTNLQKYAKTYIQMEEVHNVNAIYAASVSKLESGNGTSNLYHNNNNLFGVRSSRGGFRKFNSKEESIMDFGRMMNDVYFSRGRDTVPSIAPMYCNNTWGVKINKIMNSLHGSLS